MTNKDDKKIQVEVNKGHNRLMPSRKIGADQAAVASNVRFEDGGVSAAPGHERIEQSQDLDGASNQTFKTNLVTSDPDLKNATVVGAEGSVYYLRRRTQLDPCQPPSCAVRVGVFADSGNAAGSPANTEAVANLVKGWNPHAIVTGGDNVYAQSIEASIGQWWVGHLFPYGGLTPPDPFYTPEYTCVTATFNDPFVEYNGQPAGTVVSGVAVQFGDRVLCLQNPDGGGGGIYDTLDDGFGAIYPYPGLFPLETYVPGVTTIHVTGGTNAGYYRFASSGIAWDTIPAPGPNPSTFGNKNRFWPALGNHDYDVLAAYQNYFPQLANGGRYYDKIVGPIHFFFLSSDPREVDGTSSTSLQALWLRDALAQSACPWRIVVFHHAAYTSGSAASGGHDPSVNMRWPFREWGASAIISGHNHHYERLLVGKLPVFVVGTGGFSLYGFSTPVAESQARASTYGALRIDADTRKIKFRFINTAGTVLDTYIRRDPKPSGLFECNITGASADSDNTDGDTSQDSGEVDILSVRLSFEAGTVFDANGTVLLNPGSRARFKLFVKYTDMTEVDGTLFAGITSNWSGGIFTAPYLTTDTGNWWNVRAADGLVAAEVPIGLRYRGKSATKLFKIVFIGIGGPGASPYASNCATADPLYYVCGPGSAYPDQPCPCSGDQIPQDWEIVTAHVNVASQGNGTASITSNSSSSSTEYYGPAGTRYRTTVSIKGALEPVLETLAGTVVNNAALLGGANAHPYDANDPASEDVPEARLIVSGGGEYAEYLLNVLAFATGALDNGVAKFLGNFDVEHYGNAVFALEIRRGLTVQQTHALTFSGLAFSSTDRQFVHLDLTTVPA